MDLPPPGTGFTSLESLRCTLESKNNNVNRLTRAVFSLRVLQFFRWVDLKITFPLTTSPSVLPCLPYLPCHPLVGHAHESQVYIARWRLGARTGTLPGKTRLVNAALTGCERHSLLQRRPETLFVASVGNAGSCRGQQEGTLNENFIGDTEDYIENSISGQI